MSEVLIGFNTVLEALKAGRRNLTRIYISRRHGGRMEEIFALARASGIPVKWEPKARLTERAGSVFHQGIIAVVSEAEYLDIEELLDQVKEKVEEPLLLVLDGVEDPQNLGSIIRTAEAAGVNGLIIPKHRSVGLTQTVAKVSCGALEYVPVARATNIPSSLERLKGEGFWIVGADPRASKSLYATDLRGALAFVVGGEHVGLRPLVKAKCDLLVSIPMRGRISSLNTAVAAGVLLFEAVRQRGLM